MTHAAHRFRPFAFTAVASVAILASCGKQEPATPANTTAPTNQAAPSQPVQTESPAPTGTDAGAPINQTAGLMWDIPAGWESIVPDGMMRKAQYSAPAPGDSSDVAAECIVYYFGPAGQGGDAESNVLRWSQQVLDDQGAPSEPARMEFTVGDLKVTTVAFTGAYLSGMPGGPTTPMPDYQLLGAIIEGGPQGSLFIKMTGPTGVVDSHREAWELMVRSFRPVS